MASTDLFLLDLEHDKDAICCRGVDRSGAFRALRITGFRPHFYWGPVETSGDAAGRGDGGRRGVKGGHIVIVVIVAAQGCCRHRSLQLLPRDNSRGRWLWLWLRLWRWRRCTTKLLLELL